MAKSKYCYAIVNKENGELYVDCGRLSIYYNKEVAQEVFKYFDVKEDHYCIQSVNFKNLNKVILTSYLKK